MLASLFAISPAAGDRTSVHATASGDVAYTDNVFAEERGQADGDLFVQLRPGLLLSYGVPRMIHDLELEAEVTYYALHSDDASFTGRGTWRALLLPGPRSTVSLQVNAGSSVLSALTTQPTPDPVMVQPLGKVTALTADASEAGSYLATRELRLSQSLFARGSKTDDHATDPTRTSSAEAGALLAIERGFRMSTLSLEVGASILRLERMAPIGAVPGSRLDRQVNPRARVQWRRDIDRKLSGTVDGGAVLVMPYGTDPYNPMGGSRRSGLFPVVGGQLAYTDAWGLGTLSLRREVTPSLFLAQNTVTDSAVVGVALPFSWGASTRRRAPKLVGLGALSVQRTQLVDPVTSDLASSIGLARLAVGLQYAARPGITYGVRYELTLQTGDDAAAMPITGFFRNTLFFTFRVRYPEDIAFQVPRRRQDAVRADRKDLAPVGSEPVVPDLLQDSGDER